MEKETILTGLKPTGDLHMGNYFGSIRQIIDTREEGTQFMFLADLHALTDLSEDGKTQEGDAYKTICDDFIRAYVALGVDPDRTILYRQSEFPQITELMWILACLMKFQFFTIGHAYKDMLQHDRSPGTGIFLYPALMAADILLPDADSVPVGKDQIQHIEMTREMARRFNSVTKTTYFKEPKARVMSETEILPGTDGKKMSKSKNNTLPIFGDEEETRKKIMSIVTDSTPEGRPIRQETCIVCHYLKILLPDEEYATVAEKCSSGSISYKEMKDLLAETYLAYFEKARKNFAEAKKDPAYTEKIVGRHRKMLDALFTKRLNEIKTILGLAVTTGS